ncbi:unnamed protein product [Prorocentrum cordatum]|uniref:Uncharacterized protein n=1 Tax=Prorocentrum cordatum TaxID=2364126 RepID=A0ABN9WP98_9DINO|nr:unnamed protein product [Polarella glacialis]
MPALAARRGLAIAVDTRWQLSKDGVARIRHSAASRLLSGSSADGARSRACGSCAGDSGRAAAKPAPAQRAGKGELDDDASTRFSRQLSAGSTSMGLSRQVSTGSASSWPPNDWSVESQTLRCLVAEQRVCRIQERPFVGAQ